MFKSKNMAFGFSLIVILLLNFLVFNIALKKEVDLVSIPVALESINPREKISKESIGYLEVPSVFFK